MQYVYDAFSNTGLWMLYYTVLRLVLAVYVLHRGAAQIPLHVYEECALDGWIQYIL